MAHRTDDIGLPVDPELRRLQLSLGHLAGAWRGSRNDPQKQVDAAEEYRRTLLHLYELGWDAVLHPVAQLPDELMPEVFYEHNPLYRY